MVIFPCNAKTKQPLVEGGFKSATNAPAMIEGWWSQWPAAMIGLPTGKVNKLFVVDIDCDPSCDLNGFNALESLERKYGPLPHTCTQRTPRGGEHRLFRHPGFKVRNSASKLGKGIDVRGDGGYIIVAPSVNAGGLGYAWTATVDMAVGPPWALRPGAGQPKPATTPPRPQTDNQHPSVA